MKAILEEIMIYLIFISSILFIIATYTGIFYTLIIIMQMLSRLKVLEV
jgi:hypothetical protein